MLGEGVMFEIFYEAFRLLLSFDKDLYSIIGLSLYVSGVAVVFASVIGVVIGTILGIIPERKIAFITKIIYTLMGLPPVVGGLLVYMFISRRGILGGLGMLFTPRAMILAQIILALPIVIGLTMVTVRVKTKDVLDVLKSLGASKKDILLALVKESRYGILGAVIAGFGRVIAEVGAVMMVGGNIEGHTRVLTTAIVLETRRGNFNMAMALGIILLLISFIINIVLYRLQKGKVGERYE